MKTEVILKRNLFDQEISQKSKSGFFSLNDLFKLGNKHRILEGKGPLKIAEVLSRSSVKEFIEELSLKYGEVIITTRGKNGCTWVHPLIFIDIALLINPKLKIETYEWLFDNLIKFRNDSGDSYREMCGALYSRTKNHQAFSYYVSSVAEVIKRAIGVEDWNSASEQELKLRDKIHNEIKLYCNVLENTDQCVKTAIRTNCPNFKIIDEIELKSKRN